jgi:hypothetical protein
LPNFASPAPGRIVARTPYTRNILDIYARATVAELAEGLSWYSDAHAVALALDPQNPTRAAGVIAALSPRAGWGLNVNLAARAYADGEASGTLGMCKGWADRILAGEAPLEVLGGRKVRAFFACISDPESREVVVDRHAFDVAVGRTTNDVTRKALDRAGQYDRFAHHYELAAERLDLLPSQVQAVTWLTWRRLKIESTTNVLRGVPAPAPMG